MDSISKKAASWWKRQLKAHLERQCSSFENFEEAFTISLSDNISQKQLDIFEEFLSQEIEDHLKRNGCIELTCKIYPCEILERCGNRAGFLGLNFPRRTYMVINNGKIKVKNDKLNVFKAI